jgi:ABC-type sugar transport system permease subunit
VSWVPSDSSAEPTGADPSGRARTARALVGELRALRRQRWGNLWGYVFIAPALALYLVFNIWTIVRGLLMAFTDYRFLFPKSAWEWNGLENFAEMVSDEMFWHALGISAKFSLMVLPTTILLALVVAILISRVRRAARFYRWLVYLPAIIPISVTMLLWRELYNGEFGFINNTLRTWGAGQPPNWLGDPRWVLPALAVPEIWRSFGFPVLLFLVGLYSIPAELYEAAAIDGAGAWRQVWAISLPLLKPSITLVVVLNAHIVGATEQVILTTQGGPQNASYTLGYYLYTLAFLQGDLRLGYAAAMALVVGLTSALIAFTTFRLLRAERA